MDTGAGPHWAAVPAIPPWLASAYAPGPGSSSPGAHVGKVDGAVQRKRQAKDGWPRSNGKRVSPLGKDRPGHFSKEWTSWDPRQAPRHTEFNLPCFTVKHFFHKEKKKGKQLKSGWKTAGFWAAAAGRWKFVLGVTLWRLRWRT